MMILGRLLNGRTFCRLRSGKLGGCWTTLTPRRELQSAAAATVTPSLKTPPLSSRTRQTAPFPLALAETPPRRRRHQSRYKTQTRPPRNHVTAAVGMRMRPRLPEPLRLQCRPLCRCFHTPPMMTHAVTLILPPARDPTPPRPPPPQLPPPQLQVVDLIHALLVDQGLPLPDPPQVCVRSVHFVLVFPL